MLTRLYLVYYSWALFCAFGGWVKPITLESGPLNDLCYACWGNPAGFIFLVLIPSALFLQIGILYAIYNWISSHF